MHRFDRSDSGRPLAQKVGWHDSGTCLYLPSISCPPRASPRSLSTQACVATLMHLSLSLPNRIILPCRHRFHRCSDFLAWQGGASLLLTGMENATRRVHQCIPHIARVDPARRPQLLGHPHTPKGACTYPTTPPCLHGTVPPHPFLLHSPVHGGASNRQHGRVCHARVVHRPWHVVRRLRAVLLRVFAVRIGLRVGQRVSAARGVLAPPRSNRGPCHRRTSASPGPLHRAPR